MSAERNATSRPLYEHLDTAFVNLGALVRYLQQRAFVGRIHVVLDEYEAEVLLDANLAPRVREVDYTTGRRGEGAEAMARLLVRAREPGGLVSVYEGTGEDGALAAGFDDEPETAASEATEQLTPEESEWRALLGASGEVIAAIERAALSVQADFASVFRTVRLEVADDFSFLDPSTKRFAYAHGSVRLHARTGQKAYVAGLSECLRRVVDKIAKGERSKSWRERVALELAVLARRRQTQLARFKLTQQFDRIAGTRVL